MSEFILKGGLFVKWKRMLSAAIVLVMVLGCVVFVNANSEYALFEQRGEQISDAVGKEDENVEPGVISNEELEVTKAFYLQQGYDETQALNMAKEYLIEREAMYLKALDEGYAVTDEELEDYLIELKDMLYTSENKEEVEALISQFENEDAYWEYEHRVYEKNLPIQKYTESLEQEYDAMKEESVSTQGLSENQVEKQWEDEFEEIKTNISSEYADRVTFEE